MEKLFIFTDKIINNSDSIARYIIDLANALSVFYQTTVFSTNESKTSIRDSKEYWKGSRFSLKVGDKFPVPTQKAIFHFHLTFSTRKHTRYLLENIKALKNKAVVTFHVSPAYAKFMSGSRSKNIHKILDPIIKNNILIYVFSNYSKQHFQKYGVEKIWVLEPGLDIGVYDKYKAIPKKDQALFAVCNHKAIPKKDQALFAVCNPMDKYIDKVKGRIFLPQIKNLLVPKYKVINKANLPFFSYLKLMAQSKFYLALSEYEHYGLSIIDAFNLGTIPIYNNKGGLTESVGGRGIPLFVHRGRILNTNKKIFFYDVKLANNNYASSQIVHDIKTHAKKVAHFYKLIETRN